MVTVKRIYDTPAFFSLSQDWNRLLASSPANNIFLTWEWVSTWWEVFGKNNDLLVLAFYHDNSLVGLASFYLRERRIAGVCKIKELRFLGCGETVRSEYMDIICLPDYREECLDQLADFLSKNRDWDVAVFSDLPQNSLLGPFLQNRFGRCKTINQEPCYYVTVPETFDAYLESIDSRTRRNIRNRRRNLERDFSVSYRRLGPEENLEEWMTEFKRLHAERLRERGLPSKFSDPRYDLFHSRVSRLFQERGWLFAADLRLNDKMVAARYNFIYNNKVYDYQTGFDPAYSKNGVMQALISYIIELAIKENIREFDFLAGDDEYKRRFANCHRKVFTLQAINNTPRGIIYDKLQRVKDVINKTK